MVNKLHKAWTRLTDAQEEAVQQMCRALEAKIPQAIRRMGPNRVNREGLIRHALAQLARELKVPWED